MTSRFPHHGAALEKADYLVSHKGEMTIELWNDRAQCVLAPLASEVRDLEARIRALEEATRIAETLLSSPDLRGVDTLPFWDALASSATKGDKDA